MRSVTAAVALAFSFAAAACGLEIPLTVEEPVGAARDGEIVSGGIPLPEGKYKDPAAFSLADGTPVQVSPIVKYPDGSHHWVLVSFPVKLGANEKKTYTLKDAAGAASLVKNPVVLKENGDTVELSNGLVSVKFSKASFNGFDSISYKGKEVFKTPKVGLLCDGKGGPGKLTHFSVPHKGPVHTALHLKGTYAGAKTPTWAMVVTLNAGESALRVEHNLRNGALGVKGKIEITRPTFHLGVAGKLKASGGGTASSESTGRRKKKVQPSYGWKDFSGDADVTVFLRHGGPTGVKGGTLTYDAAIAGGELVIDLNTVKGNARKLLEGAHKITEIDLIFGKSEKPEALAEPLHALAPCAWYAEHDGMGVGRGFGSLADETATYENAGWKGAGDAKKMPNCPAAPNLYKSWLDVHETSECDQISGLVLGYVRTGQRGFLDRAAAWDRYWRTRYMFRTDEFTYGKEGRRGSQEKFGVSRTCAGGCHTYGVGIFGYALLTGNVDALEAAFELAEQCNAVAGSYNKKGPGRALGFWGSRGFVRNYQAVARAYDVARTPEWRERLICFVNTYRQAPDRDPRGFINHGYVSKSAAKYINDKLKGKGWSPAGEALEAKEGVTLKDRLLTNAKYGAWPLKEFGTWPAAMGNQANLVAYQALTGSDDPVAQVAADDALDMAIVASRLGHHYAFDRKHKAVYYYMFFDWPIPGYAPLWKGGKYEESMAKAKRGPDSWYTKWWPNTMAAGYKLTGEKAMKDTMVEILWWGLARGYVKPPSVPEGEAPRYANVSTNTKGDWMTTTALAFGVGAHPKKDETAPAAVKVLAAKLVGGNKVELTWTAPDARGGKLMRYQVKWSHKPLADYPVDGEAYRKHWKDGEVTVTYWNVAKNVAGEPAPGAAGKAERMVVKAEGGTCSFALRSFDDAHNRSAMSNVVTVEVK